MQKIIQLTSDIGAIIAGILVIILWLVAANDKNSTDSSGAYQCTGCNYIYHDTLSNGSSDLNTWLKNNRDAYPILIAFGVICGVFWMVTGGIGFIALNSDKLALIYLASGVVTYLIFVVIFPIIVERINWVFSNSTSMSLAGTTCSNVDNWYTKHMLDSTEQFWGSSLAAFILGGYQIAAAVYLYATIGAPKS